MRPGGSSPSSLTLPSAPGDTWNWTERLHSSLYKLLFICTAPVWAHLIQGGKQKGEWLCWRVGFYFNLRPETFWLLTSIFKVWNKSLEGLWKYFEIFPRPDWAAPTDSDEVAVAVEKLSKVLRPLTDNRNENVTEMSGTQGPLGAPGVITIPGIQTSSPRNGSSLAPEGPLKDSRLWNYFSVLGHHSGNRHLPINRLCP